MIVVKFGGTSVGSADRILGAARLVAARRGERPLVVVSAMAGVTDLLLAIPRAALAKDRAEADAALTRFGERHLEAVAGLGLDTETAETCRSAIAAEVARLADLSMGISLLGVAPKATEDAVAASGELLSSLLFAEALRALGVEAERIDPRALVATDATHGAALPDEAVTAERARRLALPALAAGRVVVTGGFVGSAPDGSTTTLGRGGSDYSAALLGAALSDSGADVAAIEIWTDVDGILTADPRVVPLARPVPEVSYAEAAELAFFGAKVLHPATIRPAVARGIPVVVRNTFRPGAPGTAVKAEAAGSGVRALAARTGVAAILVRNPRMLLAHGYAARVFSVFEKHAVPVDVIATSEVSISITVDAKAALEGVVRDLGAFADVEVVRDLAVVSVVGRGLRTTPGIAARLFGALRGVNVFLVSQGASDTNLTFAVAEADVAAALRLLHAEFFEGGTPHATDRAAATATA